MTNAPFAFFDAHVLRTETLSPTFVRVTFAGPELAGFASGGRDQRFKLFLPHPGQERALVPAAAGERWYPEWSAMDPDIRAVMRTYTVRDQRHAPEELDVDFALHGDVGPASRWAARARPGDHAVLLGPTAADNGGIDFRPPPDTDWVLLAGDETALPAIAGILDRLPAGTEARVFLEIPDPADRRWLPTRASSEVTWTCRGRSAVQLHDAIRAARLPSGTPYAWIAGEAAGVKQLRRHLVGERGFDRRQVTFTGYWRSGTSEDQLLAQATLAAVGED
ncbi:siderophore-interacting protein [Streptomyces spiramenti]|uniref:Siderophore-interacting protein n=1 Tax=Streptomyces spiramenti TaxID=2720606 RepID=A0ABX1AQI9_9ACTN|nr:siderophore-interacting protein [Streptomyces spiramenti]NJP68575.1 siderophore-interacting protein [Streptomyces spiramenti]